MNKQLWNMYKESPKGKTCIELFNPEVEDAVDGAFKIWKYSANWGAEPAKDDLLNNIGLNFEFYYNNIMGRGMAPEVWTKEAYMKFAEEYDILDYKCDDKGEILFNEEGLPLFNNEICIIKKNEYRLKATKIPTMSLLFYYAFGFFKPILLPNRFDVIQRNCDALGIEMPEIPRTNDYKEYLAYYYDICEVWNEFQKDNELTDAELCACIYDFANMLIEEHAEGELPKPTNVWLTGASKGDFAYLDSLGENTDYNLNNIWACNERTRRGDIIVLYCTSPRSYIHSIWRSNSGGIFNPFDLYHCRTTVRDGIRVPQITFKDLKNDEYMSQVPIVRRNLQGVNGIELSAEDYAALMRMIQEKGGDTSKLPQLFEGSDIDFGEIELEKDVEEKILIPMLKKLGYVESDWTRQLPLKAGHNERAIPDFVFFPRGERHFETAPMVIEVKLDMSSTRAVRNTFGQGLSYAKYLHSSFLGICDKERLIVYKADANEAFDRDNPIFEDHWAAIYADPLIGAKLNKLIGKEVIKDL